MAARKYLQRKIVPVDPLRARNTNQLVTALKDCSFQARNLAYALDVWEAMCRDKSCFRVMSLAGAMVPAGMGMIICRLIEKNLIHAIVCTGATISHDMCNTISESDQAHYIGNEFEDDIALRQASINRIYDTLLAEADFQRAEKVLMRLFPKFKFEREDGKLCVTTTSDFVRQLGAMLPGRSILTAAAKHNVAIFVPAISDSELGLNAVIGNQAGRLKKGRRVVFDTLSDIEEFAALVMKYPRSGLISIGGGVPRNWAQQVYPFLNMKSVDRWTKAEGYHYGIRITTDRPDFGGLSGCTISESKSWGKYETQAVETSIICDATIALPLLTSALLQRLGIKK